MMMMMMFHHPRDILCQSQHRSALSFVRSFVRSNSGLPRYRVTSISTSMSRTVVVVCCLLTLLVVVVDVVQNIQLYRYPAQGIDYCIPVCRFGISFSMSRRRTTECTVCRTDFIRADDVEYRTETSKIPLGWSNFIWPTHNNKQRRPATTTLVPQILYIYIHIIFIYIYIHTFHHGT